MQNTINFRSLTIICMLVINILYAENYTPGELRLLGITNTQHTYNPSKQIGEAIKEKGKNNSAYEKTKFYLRKAIKIKNNSNNTLQDITYKMDLPVKIGDTKPTQIFKGTVSWSLVNEKCEIDPEDVFQKAMNNLVEKYKEFFKKLLDKELWKMWAINKMYQKLCQWIAKLQCIGQMEYLEYVNQQEFQTEYQDCMANATKGALQVTTKSRTGTTTVAAGFTPGSGVAPTSNPTAPYFIPCGSPGLPPCGMPFTLPEGSAENDRKIDPYTAQAIATCYYATAGRFYGKGMHRCLKTKEERCYSFFNGKIDLGIDLNLPQFKIEQQSCILKKYNMEIDLQDIIIKGMQIEKNGDNAKIIMKNTVVSDPNTYISISNSVIKQYNPKNSINEIYKEYFNIVSQNQMSKEDFAYGLLSYLNFLGWTDMLLNTPSTIEVYKTDSKEIKYTIGRWPFPTIEDLKKEDIGLEYNYPTSIYEECNYIINLSRNISSSEDIDGFFKLIGDDKHDPFGIELRSSFNGSSLAPGFVPNPINGNKELTGRNIYASLFPDLYQKLYKNFKGEKNFMNYVKHGIPYFDLKEIINMNKVCQSWAAEYEDKLSKMLAEVKRHNAAIIAQVKNDKKYDRIKKVVLDKLENDEQYYKLTMKALDFLRKSAEKNLMKLQNLLYKIENKGIKEIKPKILYESSQD